MSDWWMTVGAGARRPPGAGAEQGVRPRFRIVALPHAGGWPSAFRSWWHVLPADVELLVAQLPGRGARINEPPLTRVAPQVEALGRALAERDPLPYAVIGHSFGSVLGYELTRAMERRGLAPRLLAVSARQPPCFPSEPPFAHLRSDAELLEHLVDIGGMAPGLMDRPDLVQLSLHAVRADLEAMERYERPATGTSTPVLALGAVDDPVVIAERLHLWSLETSGGFSRLMFTGGHFYLYAPAPARTVAGRLLPDREGPRAGNGAVHPLRRPIPVSGGHAKHLGKEPA
ncbi:thioesterase domain-containing protein [Streptomyces sp. NBC_00237]|uniref:thioesterase II family protein n=1 Tax=Streptomyces sp. NBC_00237 TaxID=2975687 RepID=UPI00224DEC61|nr:thioesterase domain-containing protein [Streptomyces sp. NBC_00237]MCX5205631.1 thioesterase domain-containing protein [Streptomyces sp. NBC_00237]